MSEGSVIVTTGPAPGAWGPGQVKESPFDLSPLPDGLSD